MALIAALRADRNESVRVEAAFSLGNGGGRTGKTLEALRIVLGGSEQDGNPAESSEHVKAAALTALNHCQTRSKSSIALEMPQVPPPTMIAGPPAPLTLQLTSAAPPFPIAAPVSLATPAERAFAETVSTPKNFQDIPELPRNVTYSPPVVFQRGLAPIGAVPRE